ncbi:PIG-L deacetylase family protein [Allonocardiopsis opalescens]|uniref:LmbE family N-acetylglucosaminyl deacetylase n=1 Tax=Allonocardiopsis opalescens TaxID=1144618 RepID=A0A2T0Q8G0_9ACTN|nr:PIG-L deacetylase family protein [Allonocardiopsis opalescens]PRY00079.1 LmbE family N-acetylglucosaminyl deacetylase [Allonocardiopsis opalescens]
MLPDAEVERVLVIAAHPDDADFASAGTVARWTREGIAVTYLLVTDGDAGGFDPDVPRADIPGIRRAEQTAAAAQAGVTDLRFLGYRDGTVEPTIGLRRDLARVIRQVRPDRVLTHSPDRNYAFIAPSHPDHRAVGAAAIDAVYPDARNPFAHPELLAEEGLAEWTVREMWLSGGPEANHASDVTDTLPAKLAALRAHQSQMTDPDGLTAMITEYLAANARDHGLPEGRYAELFQVISTA